MAMPAYVTRRIALNATCDLINKHGYACLGTDYEGAARRIEEYLKEDDELGLVVLDYSYKEQEHQLVYEGSLYE